MAAVGPEDCESPRCQNQIAMSKVVVLHLAQMQHLIVGEPSTIQQLRKPGPRHHTGNTGWYRTDPKYPKMT